MGNDSYEIYVLTRKLQCVSGICAEKALVQYLCERFHYSNNNFIIIYTNHIVI